MVHPCNGILFSNKSKWAIKPWKDMEESWIHIAKWKKPAWKVYMVPAVRNPGRGQPLGTAKISGCQGQGNKMNRWNTEDFHGSETILYDAVMVNTWHYAFGKIHTTVQQKEWNYCKLWRLVKDNIESSVVRNVPYPPWLVWLSGLSTNLWAKGSLVPFPV